MRTFLNYFNSKTTWLCALLIAGLATVFTAYAVHDEGVFELDGNTLNEGADDWDDVYNRVGDGTPDPLPAGNFDANFTEDNRVMIGNKLYDISVYTTGSSDTKDISTWGCTKKTNLGPKFDFEHGYNSAYELSPSGDTYVAMGADRIGVNGNSAVGIWLLQEEVDCIVPLDSSGSGAWSGNHRDGDLLITSDFENGGRLGTVNVFNWVGDASGSLVQESSFAGGAADCQAMGPDHHAAIPEVCLTTNGARDGDTDINTPWAGTLEAGRFVEGAVNITQYFGNVLGKPEPCFNTMIIQARASASASAHTHDYIVVPLDTCGKVILEKATDPANDPQDFQFRFGENPGSTSIVGSIGDGESIDIVDVFPGTYQASEDAVAGWDLDSVLCKDNYDETTMTGATDDSTAADNINVSRAETVHCLFTNVKRGKIIIKKVVDDPRNLTADSETFGYTGGLGTFNITVDTSASGSFMESKTFDNLVAGTYVVTEDDPSIGGFSLTGLVCDDDGSATPSVEELVNRKATINLDPGETVTCTYTNERLARPGTIIIEKITVGGIGAFSWVVGSTPDEPGPGLPPALSLDTDPATNPPLSAFTYPIVEAGTYTFTEQNHPDFDLTGLVCGIDAGMSVPPTVSDPGTSVSLAMRKATVDIEDGEVVRCIFTNSRLPQLKVVKDIVPDTDTGLFNLLIDGMVKASDVGDGGNTGFHNVSTGTHTVGETAGTGTDLNDYESAVSCDNGDAADPATGLTTSALAYGDKVTCTIVNNRKLELCPEPGVTGRPLSLTMAYDGDPASNAVQIDINAGDVIIDPDPPAIVPATVRVDLYDHRDGLITSEVLNINDSFTYAGFKGAVPPRSRFEIFDNATGNHVQTVQFHTSCSQPLNVGESFGLMTIIDGVLNQ